MTDNSFLDEQPQAAETLIACTYKVGLDAQGRRPLKAVTPSRPNSSKDCTHDDNLDAIPALGARVLLGLLASLECLSGKLLPWRRRRTGWLTIGEKTVGMATDGEGEGEAWLGSEERGARICSSTRFPKRRFICALAVLLYILYRQVLRKEMF